MVLKKSVLNKGPIHVQFKLTLKKEDSVHVWWPRTANRKIRILKEELFYLLLFFLLICFFFILLNEIKKESKISFQNQTKVKQNENF